MLFRSLTAFEQIRQGQPRAKLVFVGDGPSHAELQSRCPYAVFAGMRTGENLAVHYASGDLFLFPSLTETFGNVVPEALASGLGVVAFGCAAAADLIEDGVNGRVAPPGDNGAFIRAALELARVPEQLAEIRDRAAPSVAPLDWERIHDRFALDLAGLVSARQRRRQADKQFVFVPD